MTDRHGRNGQGRTGEPSEAGAQGDGTDDDIEVNPAERPVALLAPERIEQGTFRGSGPQEHLQRVFGGQVAGQALIAVGRTTDGRRPVHSLHA